jgi:hypothetical protein
VKKMIRSNEVLIMFMLRFVGSGGNESRALRTLLFKVANVDVGIRTGGAPAQN